MQITGKSDQLGEFKFQITADDDMEKNDELEFVIKIYKNKP
jgi:hypothetical protein